MAYLNKLQTYRTAIKNLHWSAKNIQEHKLVDDIDSAVSSVQDTVAEIAQGIYGQIKLNELKPKGYKITSTKKMLQDLLSDTQRFYKTLGRKELVGIKSEMETFIGSINKFLYLLDLCLKEDLKRRLNKMVNEEKKHDYTIDEISCIVEESLKRIIKNHL
jgi:DNA-binding transcriptional regulator YhcF (GntR family)